MNFVKVIVEAIKADDFTFFKMMVKHYKKSLNRDGQFVEYVDRIAKYYFNGTVKSVNPMQQMMQNMMGG